METMNQYELMYVFDPNFATDYTAVEAEVRRLMERCGASDVRFQKWDERRLAYKIKGRKRGFYVLSFFKASGERIASLERDIQLSENILRHMIVRADYADDRYIEREFERKQSEPAPPGRGPREEEGDGGRGFRRRREPDSVGAGAESRDRN